MLMIVEGLRLCRGCSPTMKSGKPISLWHKHFIGYGLCLDCRIRWSEERRKRVAFKFALYVNYGVKEDTPLPLVEAYSELLRAKRFLREMRK